MPASQLYKFDRYGVKNGVNLLNPKLAVIKSEVATQHTQARK